MMVVLKLLLVRIAYLVEKNRSLLMSESECSLNLLPIRKPARHHLIMSNLTIYGNGL